MRRKFHAHFISGTQSLKIPDARSGHVRRHYLFIPELHSIRRARQQLHDSRLLAPVSWLLTAQGLVSTHGPFAVMATVCSKCAEYFPSSVTAVHLSALTRLPAAPAFTIGSMAST